MRIGLCDDLANWTSLVCSDAKSGVGCQVARTPIGWNRQDDPTVTAGIARIREARLRPLVCVWFHTSAPPTAPQYQVHARRFAERFPNAMIELLNEPNHPLFGNLAPEVAAHYVNGAAEAIRALPNGEKVKLLGPAPVPHGPWRDYFRRMQKAIANNWRVEPTLHLYPTADRPLDQIVGDVKMAAAVGLPVHVTEMGFQAGAYGKARQAELTEAALKRLAEERVATTVVYRAVRADPFIGWEADADLSVLDQPRLRQAVREGGK
jgi:Glycosyl hydrolase catalytic core